MTENRCTWRNEKTRSGLVSGKLSAFPASAPQDFPDTFFLRPWEIRRLFFQKMLNSAKDLGIHCWGYAAGLRVLLARVVDAE